MNTLYTRKQLVLALEYLEQRRFDACLDAIRRAADGMAGADEPLDEFDDADLDALFAETPVVVKGGAA